MIQKLFNGLLITLLFIIFSLGSVYAAENLTPEEKTIFNLGVNLGRTSYLLSDIISNNKVMGLSILLNKLGYLKNMSLTEIQMDDQLKISKKANSLGDKFVKEVNNAISTDECDYIKMELARKTFADYSELLRNDIRAYYGNKYTWLFDTAVLSGFTNISMQSDYERRLVLTNFAYLVDSVPYELPTSVITSLSSIATVNESQLTASQVDVMKGASENIITYFTNPESYTPPATIRNLVGKWEGRLQDPNGVYHRSTLIINPDLTGYINVDSQFNNMPVRDVVLTQNSVSFSIKPFGEEKLVICFAGKLVDDMATGEAVDISGRKGLWQFLKTTPAQSTTVIQPAIKNEAASLDKIIGVWKGKILEENGAISNSTLYINLVDDSMLVVENDNTRKNLTVNSIAINTDGIKFNIKTQDSTLTLTFSGKVNGRILEGNAQASDGSRGYWKLVKISDEPQDKALKSKINYNFFDYDYTYMYDPVIENNTESNLILVANNIPAQPVINLKEGQYKGYLTFNDGTKAQLKLVYDKKEPEMYIKIESDGSYMPLRLTNMSINDRAISFKTVVDDNSDTAVEFKGKLFGYYLNGQAINKAGEKLTWELISSTYADSIESTNISPDMIAIMGQWEGNTGFSGLTSLPVSLNLNNTISRIKIGNNAPLNVFNLTLNDSQATFTASKTQEDDPVFSFKGSLDDKILAGKITNAQGEMINLNLEFKNPPLSDYATGLWHGEVYSGQYKADVILNFLTNNKRIIIDDSKAKTGRLELIAETFKETDNSISFKGKSSKSSVPIEFFAVKKGSKLEGYMKSQAKDAKQVNLVAYKSGLLDKQASKTEVASSIEENNLKSFDKQEIVVTKSSDENLSSEAKSSQEPQNEDQINQEKQKAEINNKTEDIKQKNTSEPVEKENISDDKIEQKIVIKDTDSKEAPVKSGNKKKSSKIKSDKKKSDKLNSEDKEKIVKQDIAVPAKQISDEGMFNKSEIDKAKKQVDGANKDLKPVKKEKAGKKKDKKQLEQNDETAEKDKSSEDKQVVADTNTEKQSEKVTQDPPDSKANLEIDQKQIASVQETTKVEKSIELTIKDILGKWVGRLTDPNKASGEIIIEFKDGESYMYVDKEGEKVPFKLFDFGINGKNISFKIKPSPDNDFGINFSGSMIEGVFSGEAIDPGGQKGQWFAKRL